MSIQENLINKTPTKEHWKKVGIRPHHGIALPLSSLRSDSSSGIGEFQDLIGLIDWCHDVGFDVIQLLPLNDTGNDISPYSAISSCALDPVYLSLKYHFGDHPGIVSLQDYNEDKRVPYHRVKKKKLEWLENHFSPHYQKVKSTDSYTKFLKENSWLEEYALYRVLLEKHEGMPWTSWSKALQKPTPSSIKKLVVKHRERINFFIYLQFLCFQEMTEIKRYAHQKSVHLKGDIPILLSPNSVDVWANQELFILSLSAGAPPDMFNAEGQNWGFPLFNWEKLRETDYAWWRQRLRVASLFFHIYRIDHIVGFFRIWAIDLKKKGAEGHFVSKNRHLWPFVGKRRLEMLIQASSMLPIAEDLGVIPLEVNALLRELGICGTRVMRWQRYSDEDDSYIPGSNYQPLSLTTVSTHDSETLAQWWQLQVSDAKTFAEMKGWEYTPNLSREQRKDILRDSHHTASLFHINPLQEYLALFPELVSENIDDERINVPGKKTKKNWTYRFRPKLEKITSHICLRKTIEEIIR